MISAVLPSSDNATATDAGCGSFATEAHYFSLAGRMIATLRDGGRFVLVTGDPPAIPDSISQALRKVAASRYAVIGVSCGPELTIDQLTRARSVVATLPTGNAVALPEVPQAAAPLFVFDRADRLTEQQFEDICAAMRDGSLEDAAGVLLTPAGFLARIEGVSLHFLKKSLAGQFCLQDIGQDENIEFLRHQLANRHRDTEARWLPAGSLRGLTILGVLLTLGIGRSSFFVLSI